MTSTCGRCGVTVTRLARWVAYAMNRLSVTCQQGNVRDVLLLDGHGIARNKTINCGVCDGNGHRGKHDVGQGMPLVCFMQGPVVQALPTSQTEDRA
jgi:hypothetical protein